jgi:DNA-binding HxlR family transcriptional regulator
MIPTKKILAIRPAAAGCPAEATLHVIGGRWKVPIIWHLFAGTRRFSELQRELPGITQKMLTQQLREMEKNGVVSRRVYAQVPPKVEYSLTETGMSLRPVVEAMCVWANGRPGAAGASCPSSGAVGGTTAASPHKRGKGKGAG